MSNYHAYLIRLWRENEQSPWRADLISSQTGKQLTFASLALAHAHLHQLISQDQTHCADATQGEQYDSHN